MKALRTRRASPPPVSVHEAAWAKDMQRAATQYHAARKLGAGALADKARSAALAAQSCAGFWRSRS